MWQVKERKKSINSKMTGLSTWVEEGLKGWGCAYTLLENREIPSTDNHTTITLAYLKIFLKCERLQTKIDIGDLPTYFRRGGDSVTHFIHLCTPSLFLLFFGQGRGVDLRKL